MFVDILQRCLDASYHPDNAKGASSVEKMKQSLRFTREKGTGEFGPSTDTGAPPPDAAAAPAQVDTGRHVAEFYASVVETSGQRWAEGPDGPARSGGDVGAADTTAAEARGSVEVLPPGQSYSEPAGPAPKHVSEPSTLVLPRNNVGYRLLQAAGWREGTGIGAREQGRLEPLQPEMRAPQAGLGFEKKKKRKKEDAGGGSASDGGQAGKPPARELPPDELAQQDLETKVKRVRQVMQAEADAKAERELARLVAREFADDGGPGGHGTRDVNPLLRRNSKSARNPLL